MNKFSRPSPCFHPTPPPRPSSTRLTWRNPKKVSGWVASGKFDRFVPWRSHRAHIEKYRAPPLRFNYNSIWDDLTPRQPLYDHVKFRTSIGREGKVMRSNFERWDLKLITYGGKSTYIWVFYLYLNKFKMYVSKTCPLSFFCFVTNETVI